MGVVTATTLVVAGMTLVSGTTASADELPTPPPLLQRDENLVTADALPTVQIDDGYVWAQTTIGTTVYAVGQFNNARAPLATPGTQLTPRSNILAFNINTGALLPFAPTVNGVVKSVVASPDGSRLYIGGSFTQVNGQTRYLFAALDATTGQLVPGFSPSVGGSGVYGMAASGDTIYVGGLFTQANGTARKNLAAFSATNGALLPWAPETDRQVDAMVMDPDGQLVIAAGRFSQVNGNIDMRGTAALDKLTGALDASWAVPYTVKNGMGSGSNAGKAGIFGLAVDENAVYGTGWVFANQATGNLEGTFAAESGTGEIRWISDCLGDHYGVYSTGKTVYTTSHTHACSTMGLAPEQSPRTHKFLEAVTTDVGGKLGYQPATGSTYKNWEGTPAPSAYAWYPDLTTGTTSGLGQAGLSITGVGDVISVAGEFGSANNLQYQGIVRFSTSPPGGAKDQPRLSGASWTPSAHSFIPGRARIGIQANWDRDDMNLTYELRRQGTSTPVATLAESSTWWDRPSLTLEDTTVTPGEDYTYTVVARDGDGNTATSEPVTVTAADGVASAYVDAVIADAPQLYYPLGDSGQDWAGNNPPAFGSGTSSSSGIAQSSTGSTSFNGSSTGRVSSTVRMQGAEEFSTELWFRTSSQAGGKLIGFGGSDSGDSSSYDRHLYLNNNGTIVFGVYPGHVETIQSGSGYNDGQWHHVAASLSEQGMHLYVDGQLTTSNPTVTSAQDYQGYWRLGGDNLNGWPSAPSSNYLDGRIDEAAVYDYALSASQVSNHYATGEGHAAPTAEFAVTASDLTVSFDGSASAADGVATIEDYSWNFGDGSPLESGETVSHAYAASGTYTATLIVTDSNGRTAEVQQDVAVLGANVAPDAEFTLSADGLTATADASESSDADGTIASYEWDWGDGTESTGQVATHTYSTGGTHTVTLRATDDRGGFTELTQDVLVTHADPVAQFSSSASGLTIAVDAGQSSASDDAALSYEWDWGDGTASDSGETATHAYSGGGSYDVTLLVTDSLGATNASTQSVQITAEVYAASDGFSRVVSSGWGAADKGGVWSVQGGSASVMSVSDGTGVINNAPSGARELSLQATPLVDTVSRVAYTLSGAPSTGNVYVGIGARESTQGEYRATAWHRSNGTVWLLIQRNGTAIETLPLSGVTWSAGSTFNLALEVTGVSPTTIKAKAWAGTAAEPADWQVQTTDSTAALQTAAAPSLYSYRSSSASGSNAVSFDDLTVQDLAAPTANTPPVAVFTSSALGLTASVDGSTSSDADGAIAAYAWDFGDGATDTGATATHVYAEAGTFTVTLTVTDDAGATHSSSQPISVSAPPVDNVAPVAAFTSSSADLTASLDGSTSSDADGAIAAYAWDFGDGATDTGATATHVYAEAGTFTVTLTVTDDAGATHSISQPVTVTAPVVVEPEALAQDDFDRTISGGWGHAAAGGAWTILGGNASAASVADGFGRIALAAGSTRYAVLNDTPVQDGIIETQFRVGEDPATGASYIGVIARHSTTDRYMVRAWLRSDGTVWLVAARGSTMLLAQPLAGVTYSADTLYNLKVSVTGSASTTLSAKFWASDATEPADWQLTTTDSSASALQTPGSFGVVGYRTGSSAGPLSMAVDTFSVTAAE